MSAVIGNLFLLFLLQGVYVVCVTRKTYIVHMKVDHKPSSYISHVEWYIDRLRAVSPSAPTLYTYSAICHGFATVLSPEEADSLRLSDDVLGVYEDTLYNLHTTRTPEFLGVSNELGLWSHPGSTGPNKEYSDVIIGVLDTGVWPESSSFDDSGMPEVPPRWNGECEFGSDFKPELCNRKLIGARSFFKGYHMALGKGDLKDPAETGSPRDQDGHGSHTASTAAGSRVANASLLGYASGTAQGMAPHARVAAYKVCWKAGCFGSDILAAIDRAIQDGVDVLSMSLGGGSAPYYRDLIAIGAFSAMQRGIVVSCSAGNSGPTRASVANVAPWILTVGASTLDRDFPAYVLLENSSQLSGVSLYPGPGMGKRVVGLVYGKVAGDISNLCLPGSLDPDLVRGKVVLCDRGGNSRVEKGLAVREADGAGMILANTNMNGEELVADSHVLPAIAVGKKAGDAIRDYVRSHPNPKVELRFSGTILNIKPSPVVAAFSSRGPNLLTPQILKPDVIGPGVNILAAWSGVVGPTGLETDTRKTQFNIISGTSMSCPHISGLAALLKAAHPDWSPSAIKSALMTTAYTLDNTGSPLRDAAGAGAATTHSTPFAHGSGHIDPHKAISPGLIYDISTDDFISFLCSLDYTVDQVKAIAKLPNVTCSRKFSDPGELNYPSFSVLLGYRRIMRYTREVTNVGPASSTYEVEVTGPDDVQVTVKPSKLVFTSIGEKKKYTVTFVSKRKPDLVARSEFGSIVWSSAEKQVRSPIAYAWTRIGRVTG